MANAKRVRARQTADSVTSTAPQTPTGDAIVEHAIASDRITCARFNADAGTWNYAGSYEPAMVRPAGLMEFIRQRGGGGRYRARIRRSDGTWGLSTTITIEGPPRAWAEPEGPSSSTSAPAAPAPSAGAVGVFERFLGPFAAAAGTAMGTLLLKKLLEDPKPDPLIFELLKRGGGVDPLELQNALAAAEARGEARGRELGQLRAEKDAAPSGPDGALGAIERGLPQVLEVVKRHQDLEERKLAPRQLTAGTAAAPAPPAPATDALEQLLLSIPIAARKFLLSAAENDEPVEVYAQMVLGKLDDVTAARLPALLERADFGDVLVRVWPAFADHREWSDSFVVALREAIAVDDEDEPTAADDASDSTAAAP